METVGAALVLAGGRGTRLGGVLKPALRRERQMLIGSLLAHLLATGVPGGSVCVVGDRDLFHEAARTDAECAALDAVKWAVEQPRFSGPVPALAAGLRAVPASSSEQWVLTLAADLADPSRAISELLAHFQSESIPAEVEAVMSRDTEQRVQPLLAVYRRGSLERSLATAPNQILNGRSPSLVSCLAKLRSVDFELSARAIADIDTPEDARKWGIEDYE